MSCEGRQYLKKTDLLMFQNHTHKKDPQNVFNCVIWKGALHLCTTNTTYYEQ